MNKIIILIILTIIFTVSLVSSACVDGENSCVKCKDADLCGTCEVNFYNYWGECQKMCDVAGRTMCIECNEQNTSCLVCYNDYYFFKNDGHCYKKADRRICKKFNDKYNICEDCADGNTLIQGLCYPSHEVLMIVCIIIGVIVLLVAIFFIVHCIRKRMMSSNVTTTESLINNSINTNQAPQSNYSNIPVDNQGGNNMKPSVPATNNNTYVAPKTENTATINYQRPQGVSVTAPTGGNNATLGDTRPKGVSVTAPTEGNNATLGDTRPHGVSVNMKGSEGTNAHSQDQKGAVKPHEAILAPTLPVAEADPQFQGELDKDGLKPRGVTVNMPGSGNTTIKPRTSVDFDS